MISLEKVTDGGPTGRNFDQLAQLVIDTGGVTASIRFGSKVVSTSAAVFGSASVTHGLGTTPATVLATADSSNGVVNATVSALGATTFSLFVRFTDDVSRTTSVTVYWLAIG